MDGRFKLTQSECLLKKRLEPIVYKVVLEGLAAQQKRRIREAMLRDYYVGRRVLVTGSTGFKGGWLCRMLAMLGAEVWGYALEAPTDPSLWHEGGIAQDVRQVIGDIRDFEALSSVFEEARPQVVLHLAAQPLVIESYHHPRTTYATNVMGTVNVLECVRLTPETTSVVNVTTDKVYENREIPGHGYREHERLDGWDPYSNSKSCSELVTASYRRSFFDDGATGDSAGRVAVSTARAGNVIGGGDFAAMRIVPDCVRAALAGKPLIMRNPNSVRPYQHVLEPLSAYLLLAMSQDGDHALCGAYNIGPSADDCVTTGTLANLFAEAWGEGFTWEATDANGPHEAGFLMLDATCAKTSLGWRPCWNVAEAVRRTVDWTRAWQLGDARDEMDNQIRDYLGALV